VTGDRRRVSAPAGRKWSHPAPERKHSTFTTSQEPILWIYVLVDKMGKTTLSEFELVFPKLVDDLCDHAKSYNIPENGLKWFREVGHLRKTGYLIKLITI
jgi:hypothetical protein